MIDFNNNETIFYFLRLSNLLNSEFLKVNKIEIKSYDSILYNIIRKYFDSFMKINRTVLCVIYLGTLPKKRSNAYTAVDNDHIFWLVYFIKTSLAQKSHKFAHLFSCCKMPAIVVACIYFIAYCLQNITPSYITVLIVVKDILNGSFCVIEDILFMFFEIKRPYLFEHFSPVFLDSKSKCFIDSTLILQHCSKCVYFFSNNLYPVVRVN